MGNHRSCHVCLVVRFFIESNSGYGRNNKKGKFPFFLKPEYTPILALIGLLISVPLAAWIALWLGRTRVDGTTGVFVEGIQSKLLPVGSVNIFLQKFKKLAFFLAVLHFFADPSDFSFHCPRMASICLMEHFGF